jgi:hypothetical protein
MMHDGILRHGWEFGVGWAHVLLAAAAVIVTVALIKYIFFD